MQRFGKDNSNARGCILGISYKIYFLQKLEHPWSKLALVLWHIHIILKPGRVAAACMWQLVDYRRADVPSETRNLLTENRACLFPEWPKTHGKHMWDPSASGHLQCKGFLSQVGFEEFRAASEDLSPMDLARLRLKPRTLQIHSILLKQFHSLTLYGVRMAFVWSLSTRLLIPNREKSFFHSSPFHSVSSVPAPHSPFETVPFLHGRNSVSPLLLLHKAFISVLPPW